MHDSESLRGIEITDTNNSVDLAEAIFRTMLYADVFDFPLTEAEIQHFLIGASATPDEVVHTLRDSTWLTPKIERVNGYYALHGRAVTVHQRHQRDQASMSLWDKAQRYGRLLAHLPFVRMVALTGALSMRNARNEKDDIDYLVITAPGRVWITRALIVVLVRLVRFMGTELCPNYVLAETALEQDRQNLFIAHELAQMIPISGFEVYQAMRESNRWSEKLLPNATAPFYPLVDKRPRGIGRGLQRFTEVILGGGIGNLLEKWERHRKMRKFQSDAQKPGSAAQLDDQRVKGHFNDHGMVILDRYHARLREYDLDN
jgi:hypothetical protein